MNNMYRIMTFNLLCGGRKHRKWQKRVPLVCKLIREIAPDSFGVQEAHYGWMKKLSKNLLEYDYVGVGREDGKKKGEFSAVFYKKDKFRASDSGNFWLSETPDKPGKGWDAACIRIASYVKLTDKSNGRQYVHFNTHLDHVGVEARSNGVKMIKEKAASFGDIPVVCTGDFNVFQDSDCYNVMVDGNMADARKLAPDTDECFTYHDFDPNRRHETIDFIFVDKETVKPLKFKVAAKMINGMYYSDHYAVWCDIELN